MTFTFRGELFETAAGDKGAWVFVALPAGESDDILEMVPAGPGFGSVRVSASIGASVWQTSIFPSKEFGTYLLPVKRSIRDREQISTGDTVEVTVRLVRS